MWCEKANVQNNKNVYIFYWLIHLNLKTFFLYQAKKSEKDVCRLFRLLSSDDEDDMDDAKKYLSQRLYLTLKKSLKKNNSSLFSSFFN
jgi:hypothetical protein